MWMDNSLEGVDLKTTNRAFVQNDCIRLIIREILLSVLGVIYACYNYLSYFNEINFKIKEY